MTTPQTTRRALLEERRRNRRLTQTWLALNCVAIPAIGAFLAWAVTR